MVLKPVKSPICFLVSVLSLTFFLSFLKFNVSYSEVIRKDKLNLIFVAGLVLVTV